MNVPLKNDLTVRPFVIAQQLKYLITNFLCLSGDELRDLLSVFTIES
jgi:hypothetical protein